MTTIKSVWRCVPVTLFAAHGLLASTQVRAQQSEDALEEIIVSAQKRSENLQDVGLSVTAFSAQQLENLGLTDTTGITAQVPGLQYQSFSPSFTVFNIRGVSQNNFADNLEAPVATYVDGAYVATMNAIGGQLFDTERVEVLRGPQGTLFGRNATGGLIQFISKAPTRSAEGYAEGSVASFHSYSLEGAAGGPLSETLSGRLSGRFEKSDGYLKNLYPGVRDGRGKDGYAARGQLLFEPSTGFSILTKLFYAKDNDVPDGYYVSAVAGQDPNTGLGIITTPPANTRETNSNFKGFLDRKTYGATVTISKTLPHDLELTSISNYLNNDKSYGEDSDITPADFFVFKTTSKHKQWSEELRLSGKSEVTRWQAGLYYLDFTSDNGLFNGGNDEFNIVSVQPHDPTFVIGAAGCPNNPPGLDVNCGPLGHTETSFKLTARNYSAFGQFEYDFVPTWTAIVGYRWTKDDKDFNYHLTEFNSSGGIGAEVFYNPGNNPQADYSWSSWAGRAQINWHPTDDALIYLSWNRGVKGGNWVAPSFVVDAEGTIASGTMRHEAEVLKAFELGTKLELLDGHARLNMSVFHYDYDGYQSFSLTNFVQAVVNRDAKVKGGELELTLRPMKGLDVMFGASFLSSKVKDVPTTGLLAPPVLLPTPVQAVDAHLPNAPSFSSNALVRYEWPALGGSLAVQVDGRYNAKQSLEATNAPGTNEDAYFVGNADVSYAPTEQWKFTASVKNFSDTEYRIYALDTSFVGNIQSVYGAPRSYEVSAAYKW